MRVFGGRVNLNRRINGRIRGRCLDRDTRRRYRYGEAVGCRATRMSRASIVIACDPGLNARVVFSELPPVWYFKAPLAYTSIVCTGLWPPALAWMANGDPTVAFDAGVLTITACDWTLTFTP